ncbi:hypothetical protein [Paenibacillus planticolens]|uniref:Uncharacterized protein n=1 Tax=Paenibacillus planticolens TaxID=2654976 RepID=A0ABX1ZEP9_9BACL|nr:hypothetical protein [Paenibacillus planticolens]NOU98571.1 hypothetical protein [Paenibacillus planticolens]
MVIPRQPIHNQSKPLNESKPTESSTRSLTQALSTSVPGSIHRLHRMFGNQAVQRMFGNQSAQHVVQRSNELMIQRYEESDVEDMMENMYKVKKGDKNYHETEKNVNTILGIAEETGFLSEVKEMANSGRVLNPDGFYKTITAFNAKAKAGKKKTDTKEDNTRSSKGFIREILFALEQIKDGNQVQFGTMGPDPLADKLKKSGRDKEAEAIASDPIDLGYEWGGDTVVWGKDTVETRQHKVIEGEKLETFEKELIKAVKQLDGQNGEVAIKDSVRIADLVIMEGNELMEKDAQFIRGLIETSLKKNTFRKKPLHAFVDSVQVTTAKLGQVDYRINKETGDVTYGGDKSSDVVNVLNKRDPAEKMAEASVGKKKQARNLVAELIEAKKKLESATDEIKDELLDDPRDIQERIQLLEKVISIRGEIKKEYILSLEGVKDADSGIKALKKERGQWISKKKRETDTADANEEGWKNAFGAQALQLKEQEDKLDEAEKKWGEEKSTEKESLENEEKRKRELTTQMETVKKMVQDQVKAMKDRSEYIDSKVKAALQEKYKDEYEDSKVAVLDERWRTENESEYKLEMKKLREEWEALHQEDGMAEKANQADEREKNGTGRNKARNERAGQNKIEKQLKIDAVRKDYQDIISAVEAIVSNGEMCDTLAENISNIVFETGNRKAVTKLMSDVAVELEIAQKGKLIDHDTLKMFTEDLCKGGKYLNFQGNLAEIRHANLATKSMLPDSKPVKIGTEEWDKDKPQEEGKPQEVDVSYIDEKGILQLREVAWDIDTLEDKLYDKGKESQRKGYAALMKKRSSPQNINGEDIKGVQMSYVVEKASESDKELIFTKIPKGQQNISDNRGGIAKYLIQHGMSLYIGNDLYDPNRLSQELKRFI